MIFLSKEILMYSDGFLHFPHLEQLSFQLLLVRKVKTDGIQTLNVGSWDAPFGITMVSDMLSVLLVLTTSIIAFACIIYSFFIIGEEREKFYYYPVVQFLTRCEWCF